MCGVAFLHFHEFYCTWTIKHPIIVIIYVENAFFRFNVEIYSCSCILPQNEGASVSGPCATHSTYTHTRCSSAFIMAFGLNNSDAKCCYHSEHMLAYGKVYTKLLAAFNLAVPQHTCMCTAPLFADIGEWMWCRV